MSAEVSMLHVNTIREVHYVKVIHYKKWSIYKRLGIRPEEKWGGYYSTLGEKRISQLPKQNTQGKSNDEIFFRFLKFILNKIC